MSQFNNKFYNLKSINIEEGYQEKADDEEEEEPQVK